MTESEDRSDTSRRAGLFWKDLAVGSYWIVGIWSFVLGIQVIYQGEGWLGLILGVIIFPALIYLAPIYAIIFFGNWFPALVAYGGSILCMFFAGKAGQYLSDDD